MFWCRFFNSKPAGAGQWTSIMNSGHRSSTGKTASGNQVMAKKEYGLKELSALKSVPAPNLHYEPRLPRKYNPAIAVVGCGGVSPRHFEAYRRMGLDVVAICDRHP